MNYAIAHFDDLSAIPCPCGLSKRAFATPDNAVASMHQVKITANARTHYHKKMTEIYLILETKGEAFLELDGECLPVKPMTSIMIKPGCRHRAIGEMTLINVAIPTFDPHDEWFDEVSK
jgi:mannose-6-phosphate isomerase-like protein (cupin superfamily)